MDFIEGFSLHVIYSTFWLTSSILKMNLAESDDDAAFELKKRTDEFIQVKWGISGMRRRYFRWPSEQVSIYTRRLRNLHLEWVICGNFNSLVVCNFFYLVVRSLKYNTRR